MFYHYTNACDDTPFPVSDFSGGLRFARSGQPGWLSHQTYLTCIPLQSFGGKGEQLRGAGLPPYLAVTGYQWC